MGYQIYKVGQRWGGYGVPATCEFPTCRRVIDRGMSYACGGEPFSELGCDRYFCTKHLKSNLWDKETGDWCRHDDDCECEWVNLCERCGEEGKDKPPFPYKPERKSWLKHLLKDESWEEWRKNNPDEVEEIKRLLTLPQ